MSNRLSYHEALAGRRRCDLRDPANPGQWRGDPRRYLYAFMLYPLEAAQRRRFRERFSEASKDLPLHPSLADKEFHAECVKRHLRAMQAGQLFLTLIQTYEKEVRSSLNDAIVRQKAVLPKYRGHDPESGVPTCTLNTSATKGMNCSRLFVISPLSFTFGRLMFMAYRSGRRTQSMKMSSQSKSAPAIF